MKPENMTLAQLREARETHLNEAETLVSDPDRQLTDEENNRLLALQKEVADIDLLIEAKEKEDRAARAAAAFRRQLAIDRQGVSKDTMEDEAKRFSWSKFIRESLPGERHEGREAELVQEGHKEARESGLSVSNPLPAAFMQIQRANEQVTGTDNLGGYTVPEVMQGFIPALRPRIMVTQLGCTTMTGLTGNITIPRETDTQTAAWKGEIVAAGQTYSKFDQIDLSPKRLTAWQSFGRQLAFQSSISVESFIRAGLESAVRQKLDKSIIKKPTGESDAPNGIIDAKSGDYYAGGDDGITWRWIRGFLTKLKTENADIENIKWLTDPIVAEALSSIPRHWNTPKFILEDNNTMIRFPLIETNHMPTGGGTEDEERNIILANWKDLILAQWSGLDFIVNPYTQDTEALIKVTIHSWWDFALRHLKSFVVTNNDVDVTIDPYPTPDPGTGGQLTGGSKPKKTK